MAGRCLEEGDLKVERDYQLKATSAVASSALLEILG